MLLNNRIFRYLLVGFVLLSFLIVGIFTKAQSLQTEGDFVTYIKSIEVQQKHNLDLSNDLQQELNNSMTQIAKRTDLNDEEKAIESSLAYAEYQQLGKATQAIEEPIFNQSENPKVYLILGDLLSIQKSYSPAIKSYDKVRELAASSDVPEYKEMSIIAEMALANSMLKQAQQESASLPKMGKRLTELVNKQQSLQAVRSNLCPCDPKGVATAGKWEWANGTRVCVDCSIPG